MSLCVLKDDRSHDGPPLTRVRSGSRIDNLYHDFNTQPFNHPENYYGIGGSLVLPVGRCRSGWMYGTICIAGLTSTMISRVANVLASPAMEFIV